MIHLDNLPVVSVPCTSAEPPAQNPDWTIKENIIIIHYHNITVIIILPFDDLLNCVPVYLSNCEQ